MKTQTIETTSRAAAVKSMPWAAKVVKVCGGYKGFESAADYETWKRQK